MGNEEQKPSEQRLFSMYNENINQSHCKGCFEQDSKIQLRYNGKRKRCPAQSFWNFGSNLSKDSRSNRLAFVGKTSWNDFKSLEKNPKSGAIYDCRDMGPDWWNDKSTYWRAVRTITEGLKLTRDDVFITNFAKCNICKDGRNSYSNITNYEYFAACKDILEKEIQITKPTHVVFLTGDNYDSLIWDMNFGYQPSEIVDLTSDSCKKKILMKDETSKKDVCWWSRAFNKRGKPNLRLLRTRHPQGAPGHFEDEIVAWVKNTP